MFVGAKFCCLLIELEGYIFAVFFARAQTYGVLEISMSNFGE